MWSIEGIKFFTARVRDFCVQVISHSSGFTRKSPSKFTRGFSVKRINRFISIELITPFGGYMRNKVLWKNASF